MSKINSEKKWRLEHSVLLILSILFITTIAVGWIHSVHLRNIISATNSTTEIDSSAMVKIEKIRSSMESLISKSRAYILLGAPSLFEDQKNEKENFNKNLTEFKHKYGLQKILERIATIETYLQHEQSIFEEALKFRQQKTESKIVGQFYQSKTKSILKDTFLALDEIEKIYTGELDTLRTKAESRSKEAMLAPNVLIPRAMIYFISSLSLLFFGMALLIGHLLLQQKRHIADRDRLYKEAQKAVLARDAVITAISYDFKEPLNVIKQITGQKNISIEDQDTIVTSVSSVEDSLKNIYDQAKFDMNNMALRLDQLSIDVILEDARLTLQNHAKQKDVRLMFDSSSPQTLAFFDRERVMRVLTNLVGNAIKVSPKNGKVMVSVRSNQQFVYISVEDNGPGIPENKVHSLFENFWQSSTTETGAGVGLAIVKTIVEAHGGTISVQSKVGRGSTFTFSLLRRRPVGAQVYRSTPVTSAKAEIV